MKHADPVLITGCSSGIGKATARRLVESGHTVYATARRPQTLRELEAAGATHPASRSAGWCNPSMMF